MSQNHPNEGPAPAQADDFIPREKQAETTRHRVLYQGQLPYQANLRHNLEHVSMPPLSRPVLTHVTVQDEYNLTHRGIGRLIQ